MPYVESFLWKNINKLDKKSVKDLFKVTIDETESITKKVAIKDCRRYILNNWEGIERRYDKEYIGCSAEGPISHIVSARLSSRPIVGADQMARLRVHRANGGNIYETMIKKKEEKQKGKRIKKLDQRVVKRKANKKVVEKIDNITVLNIGKRTWASELFKSVCGA